jgi:hypothetical protein
MTTTTWGGGDTMKPSLLWVLIIILLFGFSVACSDTPGMLPEAEAARLAVIMTATTEAQSEAERARVAAEYANATATVGAYHMEVARINATATAEAILREEKQRAIEATATAVAFYPTATAIAQAAVERELELERQRLALAEEERRAARKARQDEMLMPFTTYGPWAIGLIVTGVTIYGLIRLIVTLELRGRAIRRDARGDAPLMLLRNGKGMVIFDGDRAFGPVTQMAQGNITMPALVDDAHQAQVTMRDQAVDLATRGLPRMEGQGRGSMTGRRRTAAKALGMGGAPAQVRVIEPGAVRGWLKDVTPQALALSMQEIEVTE